jgi:hypothetical protein
VSAEADRTRVFGLREAGVVADTDSAAAVGGLIRTMSRRGGGATAWRGEGSTAVWLRCAGAAILVLGIAVGVLGVVGARDRQAALGDAAGRVEPLTVTAQGVYRSLSDADAAAATIFLSGPAATGADADRFASDISQTSAGLLTLGVDPGASTALHTDVGVVGAELPVYTQLVATALADNRQGLPVGAAYLREASALLRSAVLPAADDAYRLESARLAADEDAATDVPVALIAVGALLAAVLAATQLFLVRRTQRWLNAGALLATLAALALTVWTAADLLGEGSAVDGARHDGQVVSALDNAELAGVRAHGDEVLGVAARGEDSGSYDQDFGATGTQLAGFLGTAQRAGAAPAATRPLEDALQRDHTWVGDHAALQTLENEPQANTGAFNLALALVTGTDQQGSGAAFDHLDADVGQALAGEQAAYLGAVDGGHGDLSGLDAGAAGLAAVVVLAGLAGIRQRLREYR